MGTVLSAMLLACLFLAWREKPLGWFVALSVITILMLSCFFYLDITQPLDLSF